MLFSTYPTTRQWENVTLPVPPADRRLWVAKFHPVVVACLALSLLCLLALVLVYRLLSEYKRVHGKILLSLSGCLGLTYSLLILDLVFRGKFPPRVCFSLGFLVHSAFLATFFWTNVMAYDVWRTISRTKPRRTDYGIRRYLWYAAYAWGATLAVSVPALIADLTEWIPVRYRPNVGLKRCWLSGTPAFLLYFNGPVGVVLLINLIFFLLTVRTLLKVRKSTMILQMDKDKERFYLYVKLFLIMGLIWVVEYVPWLSGQYKLYAVAGLLNSLHGVYLFLVFVCKRSVFRHLRDLRKNAGPATLTSIKSSSRGLHSSPAVGTAPE